MKTLLLLLLFPALLFAQDNPPSKFAPQKETQVGSLKFHVIPEFAIGASFENQTISSSATEPFFQIRIPGLVLPGLNSTNTGLAVEFINPDGLQASLAFKFLSYTRVPVAAGFYTGADVKFAQGVQSIQGSGTESAVAATAIVGFKFLSIDRATMSIELGLFTPNEPIKAALVLGF